MNRFHGVAELFDIVCSISPPNHNFSSSIFYDSFKALSSSNNHYSTWYPTSTYTTRCHCHKYNFMSLWPRASSSVVKLSLENLKEVSCQKQTSTWLRCSLEMSPDGDTISLKASYRARGQTLKQKERRGNLSRLALEPPTYYHGYVLEVSAEQEEVRQKKKKSVPAGILSLGSRPRALFIEVRNKW